MKFSCYRALLRSLLVAFMVFFTLSSCSDDDPVTGILRVQFVDWEQSWTNNLCIDITPANQEDIVLKRVDVGINHITDVELNPGNYHVLVTAKTGTTLRWHRYCQVQIGKTEVVQLSNRD